ncbi:hypothetical protein B0J11DRAFT_584629 [Dendryphion nanum]|uniref:Uncharacterized protein n=1 Tax=Dendryphion nanum TaxID=256645 RepID=A0A9P9D5X4_9PLEO|nr:hypothetical protein B0J11DRAFT_584629 [Dendryphion nanum]
MGNLCGKQSKDSFDGPGRVLGAAPTPSNNAKASVPKQAKPKVGGPPRTLGGESSTGGDARSAAAAAAEFARQANDNNGLDARASKTATGDLAKKLEAQKKQTHNQTLQQVAQENLAQRQADAATEARNYN